MSIRTRKLIGTVLILVFIAIYSFIIYIAALALQVRNVSGTTEFFFYAIGGLAWTIPVGWLIKWMARPGA